MARPRGSESRRREREFLRLLGETRSYEQAIAGSKLDPRRLPRMLDQATFAAVCAALQHGATGPIAVLVDAA